MIETGPDLFSCHVMGHSLSSRELLFRQMHFSKGLKLLEKALEVGYVDHHGRATPLLGEEERSSSLVDFREEQLRVSLELGKRLDILVEA